MKQRSKAGSKMGKARRRKTDALTHRNAPKTVRRHSRAADRETKLWLQSVGLEKYDEVFASHDIDLTVVPDLTEQDLEKLGLSLGHRRKFMTAAAKIRPASTSLPVAAAQVQPSAQTAPERRQLT